VRPELFRVFDIAFPAYFLLLLTGFAFAVVACAATARRIGQDPDVMVDLGLATLLMGVVGGRLLHVFADGYFMDYVHLCTNPAVVDWPLSPAKCTAPDGSWTGPAADWLLAHGGGAVGLRAWLEETSRAASEPLGTWDEARAVCHPLHTDCFAWAKFWAGGLTYYGGLIGASLAAWWLLKRDRFPFWKAADMAGFGIAIGLGFGRMGCLLAGCCFGVESRSRWAMAFPPHSPASESQAKAHLLESSSDWSHAVLPTQIYESAMSLAIAAFCLLYVHPRKRYDGQVFVAFLGLYAVGRFLLEFLRADDRGGLLGLSTSQLIGLALAVVAAVIHVRRAPTGRPAAPAAAAA
jgi:phosphatidylglycerol---prolipoprotein diacylglyceryl transferase